MFIFGWHQADAEKKFPLQAGKLKLCRSGTAIDGVFLSVELVWVCLWSSGTARDAFRSGVLLSVELIWVCLSSMAQ